MWEDAMELNKAKERMFKFLNSRNANASFTLLNSTSIASFRLKLTVHKTQTMTMKSIEERKCLSDVKCVFFKSYKITFSLSSNEI